MDRFDIFVKQPPSFHVEDGMAHIGYQSGKITFQCVMPMHCFARGLVDAQKLYEMWMASQNVVVVPMRPTGLRQGKRKGHAASDT